MAYQPYYYQPYYNNGAMPDMLNQQKMQYQPMPPMAQPIAQPDNELIWVQGLEGAKAYLVAAGKTVTLWDTERPTIYIKSADASGVPSMRVLDFTERGGEKKEEHTCTCGNKFAKLVDFKKLEERVDSIFDDLAFLQKALKKDGAEDEPSV